MLRALAVPAGASGSPSGMETEMPAFGCLTCVIMVASLIGGLVFGALLRHKYDLATAPAFLSGASSFCLLGGAWVLAMHPTTRLARRRRLRRLGVPPCAAVSSTP